MVGMCKLSIRKNVRSRNFEFLPQGSNKWGQRSNLGVALWDPWWMFIFAGYMHPIKENILYLFQGRWVKVKVRKMNFSCYTIWNANIVKLLKWSYLQGVRLRKENITFCFKVIGQRWSSSKSVNQCVSGRYWLIESLVAIVIVLQRRMTSPNDDKS